MYYVLATFLLKCIDNLSSLTRSFDIVPRWLFTEVKWKVVTLALMFPMVDIIAVKSS